jgi:peptidoglycan/LPS O-acetylase OafA/YrhL
MIWDNSHLGKAGKILSWLGDISFSIYLIHILVIRIFVEQFNISNFYMLLLLALFFTVFISHLTYKFIEKPFIGLAKKITNR